MEEDRIVVAVVGKELFPNRMHIEKEFGDVLYNQLIATLEALCEEELDTFNGPDIRLGVYLDSNNDGRRYFSLSEKNGRIIYDNFGHAFHRNLKEYSLREQKKGTDVLFQLNAGNISMNDFNDKIGEK